MNHRDSDKPTRVLCAFSTLDRGGAETMCMSNYRRMDRTKVQMDFVKHTHGIGAYEQEIKVLGGRIHEAPRYNAFNQLAFCKWWHEFLSAHPEYAIVHGHYFSISGLIFREAHKVGRATIGHSHCTENPKASPKRTLVNRYLLPLCNKYSDYKFACSKEAGEYVFGNSSFIVFNNAIDSQQFRFSTSTRERKRCEFGFTDNDLVVGTVGRFDSQKNPAGIVNIVKAASAHTPNVRLLWVGDGGLRREAEKMAAANGLSRFVMFTGVSSDVPELLQAMDVFIFPSFYEGLGVAAIEAQAAGLPCLCSDRIPKEVGITDLCQFLPLDQPDIWAEAILAAADTPRKDMSAAVKAAGYDIEDTSKWLQSFYLSIHPQNGNC